MPFIRSGNPTPAASGRIKQARPAPNPSPGRNSCAGRGLHGFPRMIQVQKITEKRDPGKN